MILLFIFSLIGVNTHHCNQVDIVLVADLSGSVKGNEPFIADAFNAFIDRFNLSENNVKIGLITFSNEARILSGLSADPFKLHEIANTIKHSDGMTNLTDAIYTAANMLMETGRIGAYKLMIVISDGANNVGDANYAASSVKVLNGVGICSVVIKTTETNARLMADISSGCYEEAGYENLLGVLQRMNICL